MTALPTSTLAVQQEQTVDDEVTEEVPAVCEYKFPALALKLYIPPSDVISSSSIPSTGFSTRSYYVHPDSISVMMSLDNIVSPFAIDEPDASITRESFIQYAVRMVEDSPQK